MIAKRVSGACAVVLMALLGFATLAQAQPARLMDRDITEAYQYVLGRMLVLRQEALELKEGFKWNELVHREPGGVAWANPNLDVVYSEAWIGIDETSCVLLELPEIKGRYYTVQVLNGWGEVTANINERKYPKHPFGKFALCLKGAKIPAAPRVPALPKGTLRVDLPNKKSHVLIRIELGANPADAVALQKRITMKPFGSPVIDKAVIEPTFTNDKLPGVEIFDKVDQLFASEPDQNPGAFGVQERVRAITKALADPKERVRIDEVIRKQSIPSLPLRGAEAGNAEEQLVFAAGGRQLRHRLSGPHHRHHVPRTPSGERPRRPLPRQAASTRPPVGRRALRCGQRACGGSLDGLSPSARWPCSLVHCQCLGHGRLKVGGGNADDCSERGLG